MILIGNDLVYLNKAPLNHTNDRWLGKIFSEREQNIIHNSEDPKIKLWTLWACKESAYKVLVKTLRKRFFNLKNILIFPKLNGNFDACYNNFILYGHFTISDSYVHSICINERNKLFDIYYDIIKMDKSASYTASEYTRIQLKKYIERNLSHEVIGYKKNELFIPKVELHSSKIFIDISFSHDTPLHAYACFPNAK